MVLGGQGPGEWCIVEVYLILVHTPRVAGGSEGKGTSIENKLKHEVLLDPVICESLS
jgi:hypothetical protein